MEDNNNEGFRLNGSRLFLTYPKVEGVTKEEIIEILKKKLVYERKGEDNGRSKIRSYIVSEEKHEDGKKHYHCMLELKSIVNITDNSYFDIKGYHGNYQTVKNKKKVVAYVKKGGDYIEDQNGMMLLEDKYRDILGAKTESDLNMMLFKDMSVKEKKEFWREREMRINIDNSIKNINININYYNELSPFSKDGGMINFKELEIVDKKGKLVKGFNERPLGICVYGPPNTGKTTFAKKVAQDIGDRWLSFIELKQLSTAYRGERVLIIDELKKTDIEKGNYQEEVSKLVTDEKYLTQLYYGSIPIEWPRKVVLLTNEDVKTWDLHENIKSRILFVEVKDMEGDHKYHIMNKENKYEEVIIRRKDKED